jgi:hypothetical protein
MKVNFLADQPAQTLNFNTFVNEKSPFLVPIGGQTSATSTPIYTELNTRYGSKISTTLDTTNLVVDNFDKITLFPYKLAEKTFKGGIFVDDVTTGGPNTLHHFTTIVNTRSGPGILYLQALAAQSIINSRFTKNI